MVKISDQARKHLNKRVKIKTKTGAVLYGKIVKVSGNKLYLQVSSVHERGSKAHAAFAPFIIPLVLFDLLAILLLERRRRRRRRLVTL
ncbi:hypothetical protein QNH46_18735 [Paenibacillus woosongensis]|uniref:Uncharacterized protein n=1 Tax=Paenibacillus woosongensis TaxID=307580 RepID=A0AA95I589_9BACL|nr:hypothetical protein [Paenibacillus woosongensis]WHX48127.1 hypothetical protein QNH46_18735 [Paenibacillus woosongensis]GIP60702.1 hypothetical protein J15TS10_45160 [Paenibacillus woosongensis]